jgi:hypothetical protein
MGMAKHRVPKEGRSLFGSRKRDSLFERSFTRCGGCGEDVYVLAEDCRGCGSVLNATRQPVHHAQQVAQPIAQTHYAQLTRHDQPVQQTHYAQLTRQSQPVPQAPPVPQPQPVRRPQAIHWAQQASQARMAAVRLRAS